MTTQRQPIVLLVEDQEEHGVLMRRALEKGKVKPRLFWVRDGQAALDFLYNLGIYADREASPRPDIILLDLKLPKVYGLEVLERIKRDQKLQDIPVIILTASDEGRDIIRGYKGGASCYFTKAVLFLNKGTDASLILDTVMAMAGV